MMSEIKFEQVKSSNVKAIGHDKEKQELQIEFSGGSIYAYDGISEELYQKFLEAESKGKFFDAEIKKPGFKYRRIK